MFSYTYRYSVESNSQPCSTFYMTLSSGGWSNEYHQSGEGKGRTPTRQGWEPVKNMMRDARRKWLWYTVVIYADALEEYVRRTPRLGIKDSIRSLEHVACIDNSV